MYITPDSIVYILSNCSLSPDYTHTYYFENESQQLNYFLPLAKYTLNNMSYIRHSKNKIRVEKTADDLYDCNYLVFKNSAFGIKYFYAFITNIEYINNVTSEITFEIDVIQTWLLDGFVEDCYVVREHTETDEAGDNIIPENLELGEYINYEYKRCNDIIPLTIVVAATFDESSAKVAGKIVSGVYSGIAYNFFPNTSDGASQCSTFLENAATAQLSDGIVSIFLMPTAFANTMSTRPQPLVFSFTRPTSIGNYVPKNKKLLTYPYSFLYMTNNQGNHAAFPYEYFANKECWFGVWGDVSCNPSCILYPIDYKGVQSNYDEKLTIINYPQVAYTTDTFKQWLGNAMISASNVGVATAKVATQAVSGQPISAALSIFEGISNFMHEFTVASIAPDQAKGQAANAAQVALGIMTFNGGQKAITEQMAKCIDDYFNAYGYAIKRIKKPTYNNRPAWNFIKTLGFSIRGNIPADDCKKISSIFDSGITFWKVGHQIGNYNYSNRPQS